MTEATSTAIAGAAALWISRELWSLGKNFYLDRRRAVEAREERKDAVIADVDRRFAEMSGAIQGWEIRFVYIQRELAAIDKLKSDVNAAHEKIRELHRELARRPFSSDAPTPAAALPTSAASDRAPPST